MTIPIRALIATVTVLLLAACSVTAPPETDADGQRLDILTDPTEQSEDNSVADLPDPPDEAEDTEPRANLNAPALDEPEAEPADTVYYENCADVWNRLGRPITPDDPGYRAGHGALDANGDGEGCETDPR
ncbi:MAG: excalibur calcium-binding domain-containing protein [Bifidobacteriaceae bacterium]|jgi:hypothetical protein|nr:excalibur calcium-binding domain-containing protein [Bifidobacteriaceae bacterium]